ncbi:AAA family ATPase [Salmonella enterica]|uniref:AAA family ATPase n=4 Tax=Salmonella enterica TaxID=28901 RepID=A0A727LXP9_SALET|nr:MULTISPECIES: AAA family ATPase [Enterobacteriaceae]ECT4811014.1 ATP-binding protein [Salmonella enterica subsp. enterica serovar Rubislaw]ECV4715939.1 ATP-binding protein [Salmonella enterica subsp. enterica serovar Java]EID9497216.1 AAA family ATPase [Salmonella enterica subsp. enterica serovar Muenster]EKK5415832.1 AAA family ATPase [Enterobacter hormaechei]EKR1460508.1 AAA family ATPase [Salmonella enterica subsp. salamae serovar 47:b:1,5]
MKKVFAQYHEAILPEHRGNPLIEALPPVLNEQEILLAFSHFPPPDEHIRWSGSASVRSHYVDRIKNYRCPQTCYTECYKYLERVIRDGYAARNPLKSSTQQYLHYYADERPDIEPVDGFFHPSADTVTIVGNSGSGKTTMLEQVLGYFPQVIEHKEYKGTFPGVSHQVIWIKVNCPYNASVRDLCESILAMLDNVLGSDATKPAIRNGSLARQIAQKIKSSFLGVLVIDEMQRLKFSRTGGEATLIDFLHEIVDSLGVSLVFCGNHPLEETLSKKLRIARRAESGGFIIISAPGYNTPDWQSFITYLWPLQWTNVETPLTRELNEELFLLSRGNLSVAQLIYRRAQMRVIGSGNEIINKAVLRAAVPPLSARAEDFPDITTLFSAPAPVTVKSNSHTINSVSETINDDGSESSCLLITGDLTRPQHTELYDKTMDALKSFEDKIIRIEYRSVFRSLSAEQENFGRLTAYGLLCTDPSLE